MNLDYLFLFETIGSHMLNIIKGQRQKEQRTFAASLYKEREKCMNIVLQEFQLCTRVLFQVGIFLFTKLIKCFKLF